MHGTSQRMVNKKKRHFMSSNTFVAFFDGTGLRIKQITRRKITIHFNHNFRNRNKKSRKLFHKDIKIDFCLTQ